MGGVRNEHLKVSALETQWYMKNQLLRDTDWASMAHSIEVRVPFVDINLFRALSPLLSAMNRPSKQDYALTPFNPLPPVILSRRKTGFSVPVREWMTGDGGQKMEDRGLRGGQKTFMQN